MEERIQKRLDEHLRELAEEGFEDDDTCEYCGCAADADDPIEERVVKSPTVGVPDGKGRLHATCVARVEQSWLEDAVERAERKAGWDPNP